MSAKPGTERHDCDDVEERGVIPGTTSSGRHDDWSPSADGLIRPPSHAPFCPALPLSSSDIMITGDSVPVPRGWSAAIGVATRCRQSEVAAQQLSSASVCMSYLYTVDTSVAGILQVYRPMYYLCGIMAWLQRTDDRITGDVLIYDSMQCDHEPLNTLSHIHISRWYDMIGSHKTPSKKSKTQNVH